MKSFLWPSHLRPILQRGKYLLVLLTMLVFDLSGYPAPGIPPVKVSVVNGCPLDGPPPVPQVLDNFPRVAGVTLYQATVSIIFEPGFTSEDGANFVAEIVPGTFGVPQATNLAGTPDLNMNWAQSTAFDENGNIIAETKQFYDYNGHSLQSQNKVFYRIGASTYTHVLASQPIRDAFGRNAAGTLPAPIDYADFSYRPNFLQRNIFGAVYNHQNFDLSASGDKTNNPDPIWDAGGSVPLQGTLAWYYSRYNNWEPFVSETSFPYTRQTYYQDGTGSGKKGAGAGDQVRTGLGREQSSYIAPVANELDFYIQVRNKYFTTAEVGALPTSLSAQAIQNINRDVNGVENLVIQDRGGHALMTARAGQGITISNSVSVPAAGPGNQSIWYFKLLSAGAVSVSGGSFSLYDMSTEQPVAGFASGSTLQSGYYKLSNTGTGTLSLTYSNSYADISYAFYDLKGQLVAEIAPEGVKKLYGTNGTGLNSYSTRASVPFLSQYSYDILGRPVSNQTPDGGLHRLVYRGDGKLRFSQDAIQSASGSFSYTNYDQLGRITESGQYTPGTGGITFNSAAMSGILESIAPDGGLTSGTKTDVSVTSYDLPDNSHGLSYSQDAFNLAGAVSVTKRYSTIVNNAPNSSDLLSATWFSYDEEGKMVWKIKYIKGLGYKTMDYSYDVLGNVTKKIFQKNTAAETFVSYYEYEPINKKLWHYYTNTTDNTATRQLQATYIYYLDGGLKRVELGTNLQGVDYTYTLQGALKAINNSDKTNDPGADGSGNGFSGDAFGEVVDYFAGDYSNNKAGLPTIKGVNISSLPAYYDGTIGAMSWFSKKPASVLATNPGAEAPTVNLFNYDPQYQFTKNTWGTGLNFSPTPATFSSTGINQEQVGNPGNSTPAYDGNGNILYLQRTDAAGNFTDRFTYNYTPNTNQVASITNIVNGASQNYVTYSYDAIGQVTAEATADGSPQQYLSYDATGKVSVVYRNSARTTPAVSFVYDEYGDRIEKLDYNSAGQLTLVSYYVDDVIYNQVVTNGVYGTVTPQEYQLSAGTARIGVYYPQGPVYAYELQDHLGNVRGVVARNSNTLEVRAYTDYYPYGRVISKAGDYRYGYQGQHAEADAETGWNAFELRMYNSRIGRWLQFDPQGEFFSPYVGMGNNPVLKTDPNGGCTGCPEHAHEGDVHKEDGKYFVASIVKGEAVWSEWMQTAEVSLNMRSYYRDVFLDRFQRNDQLVRESDSRYYKDHADEWNKRFTEERAAWKLQGEIYLQFAMFFIPAGELANLGRGVMRLGGTKVLTWAGKKVVAVAVRSPIMTRAEAYLAENGGRMANMFYGKGVDRAFRQIVEDRVGIGGKILNFAEKKGYIVINPSNRGADMVGAKLFEGTWWDVTTSGAWQGHVTNYGPGGIPLLYVRP